MLFMKYMYSSCNSFTCTCLYFLSGEADIVSNHVEKLISYGLKQEDIAVIAPYNLQVCHVSHSIFQEFLPDYNRKLAILFHY